MATSSPSRHEPARPSRMLQPLEVHDSASARIMLLPSKLGHMREFVTRRLVDDRPVTTAQRALLALQRRLAALSRAVRRAQRPAHRSHPTCRSCVRCRVRSPSASAAHARCAHRAQQIALQPTREVPAVFDRPHPVCLATSPGEKLNGRPSSYRSSLARARGHARRSNRVCVRLCASIPMITIVSPSSTAHLHSPSSTTPLPHPPSAPHSTTTHLKAPPPPHCLQGCRTP